MFTKGDILFFNKAKRVAAASTYRTHHVGAVLVYRGKIIASACNSNKTSPIQKKYNRMYRTFNLGDKPIMDSMHAEIACILSVKQEIDWRKAKLYIYRICNGKKRGYGLARPCKACMSFIKDRGIRRIFYTTDDGYAQERIG